MTAPASQFDVDPVSAAGTILQQGLELAAGPVQLASSFSVEDIVLIDLIYRADLPVGIFAIDTGRLNEETYEVADAVAGMIDSARHRRTRHWSEVEVDQKRRVGLKGQRARALWFTGAADAEKLTVAKLVEKKLYSLGRHTHLVSDSTCGVDRAVEMAKVLVDAGLIALVAVDDPQDNFLREARTRFAPEELVEIDVPASTDFAAQAEEVVAKLSRGGLFDAEELLGSGI